MKWLKMQSESSLGKELPQPGLKQVKVDNWGTFFLQRLQQLYYEEQLLDLTIKFPTSDITVQVNILSFFFWLCKLNLISFRRLIDLSLRHVQTTLHYLNSNKVKTIYLLMVFL